MAKIKRYTKLDGGYHGELGFFCPGCKCLHFINDKFTEIPELPDNQIWKFNGDFNKPTVRASVLQYAHSYNEKTGKYDIIIDRCHSFITDGKIEFLKDCQHELVGHIVELPEI